MADEVEETNLEWTDLEETDQGSGTSQPPFDNRVMAADSPEKPILHNETIIEQFGTCSAETASEPSIQR